MMTALAGCGGGDGGTGVQPSPQVAKPPAKTTVLIEAYGDSTMRGTQPDGSVVPNPAPAVMQAALQQNYDDRYTITVSNQGVPGTISLQLLNGSDGQHLPWAQTLANSAANIMLWNFGINDSNYRIGETHAEYRNAMTTFVRTAKAAGKIPVLEEPNPICRSTQDSANLDDFVAIMRDIAATEGATLITQYDAIKAMPNWQAMLVDCVHPNQALYTIKGQREANVVGPLLSAVSSK